jgi:hypothetical protein
MLEENSARASNYKCKKKTVGNSPHGDGRGCPGLRHFSAYSGKSKVVV